MMRLSRSRSSLVRLGYSSHRCAAPNVNLHVRSPTGQIHRTVFTESLVSVPQMIQTCIAGLQSVTEAPWWATIAMSTVFARLALLPLVRTQVISSQKMALAMPEISFLYQLLMKRLQSKRITETNERMRIISVFFHGVDACFRLYDVSYKEMFAYPIVNIGVFMTFIYSVRSMITHSDNYDLLEGGVLWFVDLSSKDPTFILPLSALSLSYLAMELGFGQNQKGAGMFFKDGLQSLVLLSVPFVTTLPAGVFCYWIPSSLFAIAQSQVMKGPYAQSLLGIPPPKLPPHLQAAQKKDKEKETDGTPPQQPPQSTGGPEK